LTVFLPFSAHAGRTSGAQSQYGEQALVMARALAANAGNYDRTVYADHFRAHFGYGGKYVGYIDHATRDTLDNFRHAEDEKLLRVKVIPFEGNASVTTAMVGKANAVIKQYQSDVLREKFEEAVRMTHDDDIIVAYGFQVLDEILAIGPVYGASDQQLPAIAKLPALIAVQTVSDVDKDTFLQSAVSAVRTTSDHPRSIAYATVCAKMMQAAINGADMTQVIAEGRSVANEEIDALLATAMSMIDQPNTDVTKHFGMACDLQYGVPSVVHNLATSSDYRTAIRANIYAGGDNCGRAMLVGAIAGAVYGVGGTHGIPQEWVDKLEVGNEVNALLTNLIG
jgi:ADP-ribosylglycohydrolase